MQNEEGRWRVEFDEPWAKEGAKAARGRGRGRRRRPRRDRRGRRRCERRGVAPRSRRRRGRAGAPPGVRGAAPRRPTTPGRSPTAPARVSATLEWDTADFGDRQPAAVRSSRGGVRYDLTIVDICDVGCILRRPTRPARAGDVDAQGRRPRRRRRARGRSSTASPAARTAALTDARADLDGTGYAPARHRLARRRLRAARRRRRRPARARRPTTRLLRRLHGLRGLRVPAGCCATSTHGQALRAGHAALPGLVRRDLRDQRDAPAPGPAPALRRPRDRRGDRRRPLPPRRPGDARTRLRRARAPGTRERPDRRGAPPRAAAGSPPRASTDRPVGGRLAAPDASPEGGRAGNVPSASDARDDDTCAASHRFRRPADR